MQRCSEAAGGIKAPLWWGAVLVGVLTLALGERSAEAYDFSFGDIDIAFDSTLTFGIQVRTESPSRDNFCTTIGGPNFNPDPTAAPSTVPDGAGSGPGSNGDCGKSAGNLNYNQGEVSSAIVKGLHELDVSWGNYSSLVRFNWWYDGVNNNVDRARTPLTDAAKKRVGLDIELLDAYVQGNWYPETTRDGQPVEIPLVLKVGNQVVSWGESTFIQNGINSVNAIDVSKIRVPGAELKEALTPAPIIWGSASLSDVVTLEGFYQFYWWRPTRLDPPGTYFSTHDALGAGGKYFDISQGHHDCDIAVNPWGVNPSPPPALIQTGLIGFRQDGTLGPTCIGRGKDVKPRNQGQFGFAARFFVPQLNASEFGLFFTSLHNRLPIVSGGFEETTAQAAARLFGRPPANQIESLQVANAVLAGTRAVQSYPEDVRKLGASFSTAFDRISTAFQGEFSYTFKQPLQISEIQLLRGLFASAGIPGGPVAPGVELGQPGEFYSGASKRDVLTAQVTGTYVGEPGPIIGGWLGASQFLFVMEMGYMHIVDFDDPDYLPLQSAVTPQEIAAGNTANQFTSFATQNSMGYVIRAALPYNNLFWGVNLTPFIGWQQDFWGFSPAPVLNFVEGRMAVNIGLRADFMNSWSATAGYTNFLGDINNPLRDRDFFAFDIKYSF